MRFSLAIALSMLLHLGMVALPIAMLEKQTSEPEAVIVHLAPGLPGAVDAKTPSVEHHSLSRAKKAPQLAPPSLPQFEPLHADPSISQGQATLSPLKYPSFEKADPANHGTGNRATGNGRTGELAGGGDALTGFGNRGRGDGWLAFGSGDGPRFARMVQPDYPARAKRMRLTGSVDLLLSIDERGNLTSVEVTSPAGHGFDEEAVRAVRRSSFHPATKEGAPVTSTAALTIRFELKQ
jgi:periplasmic protein TonB